MKQGEVWRVRLPFGPGHTQSGERPAIIVQEAAFNLSLPSVLIVPFTGAQAAARFAGWPHSSSVSRRPLLRAVC
jgi:mRNA-degrading endonuclease toxin of MazEF toxin-antitoxin module